MKNMLFGFLLFLQITGCSEKKESDLRMDVKILDEAFLGMIGTLPYQYHSLRPAPNDSIYTSIDTLNVAVAPKLVNIRKWENEIMSVLEKREASDKAIVINLYHRSKNDSADVELPIKQLRQTGRYKLFPYSRKTISIDTLSAIGGVKFSRVYYDSTHAITVATIRDYIKNGVEQLFILTKENNHWAIKEEHILGIW